MKITLNQSFILKWLYVSTGLLGLLCLFVGGSVAVRALQSLEPFVLPTSKEANIHGMGNCGANSLADACSVLGIDIQDNEIRRAIGTNTSDGTTLLEIKRAAENLGLQAQGVLLSTSELLDQQHPVIAFVRGNHFVTVAATSLENRQVFVLDRPNAPIWLDIDEFAEQWNGVALLLTMQDKQDRSPTLWAYGNRTFIGNVTGTEQDEGEFTLINQGDSAITILEAKPSCPCIKRFTFTPQRIPGRSASRVHLNIDATGKAQGPFEVDILLKTDNPAQPVRRVSLVGRVRSPFKANPNFVALGDIPASDMNRTVPIRIYKDTFADVVEDVTAEYLDPGVKILSIQPLQDGELEINLGVNLREVEIDADRRFRLVAIFDSGPPTHYKLPVGIVGRWRSTIHVVPSQLFLGRLHPGEQVERNITLSSETPFTQSTISVEDDSGIVVQEIGNSVVRVDERKTQSIYLAISVPPNPGVIKSQLKIECEGKVSYVPISGVVEELNSTPLIGDLTGIERGF